MASTLPKQLVLGDTPSEEVRLLRESYNNLLELLGTVADFATLQTTLNAGNTGFKQTTTVFKVVDQREGPVRRRYPNK
jgi:hypothetical protein